METFEGETIVITHILTQLSPVERLRLIGVCQAWDAALLSSLSFEGLRSFLAASALAWLCRRAGSSLVRLDLTSPACNRLIPAQVLAALAAIPPAQSRLTDLVVDGRWHALRADRGLVDEVAMLRACCPRLQSPVPRSVVLKCVDIAGDLEEAPFWPGPLSAAAAALPAACVDFLTLESLTEREAYNEDWFENHRDDQDGVGASSVPTDHLVQLWASGRRLGGLHLSYGCLIRDQGAVVVANELIPGGALSHLTHLDLSWNCIGGLGAAAIAGSLNTNTSLVHLNLSFNQIGDFGAACIATALAAWAPAGLSPVRTLNLQDNSIGDGGIEAIAAALNLTRLEKLDLALNFLGEANAERLAAALRTNESLTWLDIASLGVGDAALDSLRAQLPLNRLLTDLLIRHPLPDPYDPPEDEDEVFSFSKAAEGALRAALAESNPHLRVHNCFFPPYRA